MRIRTTRRQMLKRSLVCLAGVPMAPGFVNEARATLFRSDTQPPSSQSAVAAPNPEAVAAAVPILERGGNAVDAAVAALLTLCVVEPNNVGLAGYGGSMAIYVASKRRVVTIDFDSRAPLAFRAEMFNEQKANYGYLAPGVPGVLAGLDLALRKYGSLPWNEVSAHALRLAEDGFIVGPELKKMLDEFLQRAEPESVQALFPNGAIPSAGERWSQKDLASVFRTINREGSAAFYSGDIADKIVLHLQRHGGILTKEDFHRFKPREVAPLELDYRGYQLYTPPVPSAGLTSFSILKTLEQFELSSLQSWSAGYLHLFVEACKLCWEERFRLFGDPDFVQFSPTQLLSESQAAMRAERIRRGHVPSISSSAPEPKHTVNVVVVDRNQNIVSLTATHGGDFGSCVVVPGLGLVLGHGMSRFAFKPGPNFPAPGKRMQHNMAPVIMLQNGRPKAGFGMAGGRMIVTVTPQLLVDVIDFKSTAAQAVRAPRLHTEGEEPILASPGLSEATMKDLESLGHHLKPAPSVGGFAHIALLSDGGNIDAASGFGPGGVCLVGRAAE